MHSTATHAPRTAAAPCGASARCIGVVPGPLALKRSIKEKFATMVGHLTVTFKEVATCPEQRPDLARSGAAVATGPPGAPAVIMIGGYTEDASGQTRAPSSEVWGFDAAAGSWRRLMPAPTASPAAAGSPAAGGAAAAPGPRLAAAAATAGGAVWLLGGWDSSMTGPDAFLSDVWSLHPAAAAPPGVSGGGLSWAGHGSGAAALGGGASRFAAAADGDTVWVHTHRCVDHLLRIDATAAAPLLERVPLAPGSAAPPPRGLQAAAVVGRRLFIFGGAPQSGPMLDDMWVLELDAQPLTWRQIVDAGSSAGPGRRCSAAVGVAGHYLLLFGGARYRDESAGSGGLEPLGDVWAFDTILERWIRPNVRGDTAPGPRNAAVMACLSDANEASSVQLLLHGGWRPFQHTYNDTFILTVSEE